MGRPRPARGRGLDRTFAGRNRRPPEPVERPFLQRTAGAELGELRQGDRYLFATGGVLHRTRGLPALSQPMAPDPLAALADQPLSRRMAAGPQSLPHAIAGRRRRQPGPARLRRRQIVRRKNAGYRPATVEFGGDAGVLRGDPVGPLGGGAAAPVRQGVPDPRLSGMGRGDVCCVRHRADAVDRLAADQARFQSAALRGQFPLQPGAGARKLRADRAAAGRERRTRAALGPLRQRGRELVRHHEPDQAPDRVHRQLFAGSRHISLHPGGAGLLRRQDPARRADPDRIGVR